METDNRLTLNTDLVIEIDNPFSPVLRITQKPQNTNEKKTKRKSPNTKYENRNRQAEFIFCVFCGTTNSTEWRNIFLKTDDEVVQ